MHSLINKKEISFNKIKKVKLLKMSPMGHDTFLTICRYNKWYPLIIYRGYYSSSGYHIFLDPGISGRSYEFSAVRLSVLSNQLFSELAH